MHLLERFRKAAEVTWNLGMLPEGFPLEALQAVTASDVARWTLLNPDRSLNERIDRLRCPVTPTPIDEIALIILLKHLLGPPDAPVLAFMASPEASGFSLLLGFYALMQALLDRYVTPPTGMDIPPGSGVLVITANQELTSRILRTHYGDSYLGEVYQIVRIRTDGSAEPLDKSLRTAPDARWFATWSAPRRELPTTLARSPRLIIVDLMPLRHRRRAAQLVEWSRTVAPGAHLVVVAPEGDLELCDWLDHSGAQVCHLGAVNGERVATAMGRNGPCQVHPLTAAWGHGHAPTWRSAVTVHSLVGLDDIEDRFRDIQGLVQATKHERYGIPHPVRRIQWLAFDLMGLAAPLGFYQVVARHEPSVREVIHRLGRSVPNNDWERKVFDTTLPLLVDRLLEIHDWLSQRRLPPKAVVLRQALEEVLADPGATVCVLMPNRVAALSVSTWLDIEMSGTQDRLQRVQVRALQDYVQEKHLALAETRTPNHVIIGAPLPRRYVSVLFGRLARHVHFLAYAHERGLLRGTLAQVHRYQVLWESNWVATLCSLYGDRVPVQKILGPPQQMDIAERVHRFVGGQKAELAGVELVNEAELDTQALIRLWQQVETEIEDEEEEGLEVRPIVDRVASDDGRERTKAVCIELQGGSRLLAAADREAQFFSKTKGELIWDTPDNAVPGDAFVSIKSDAARDLFDLVLAGVGRTPVMIVLQGHMERWSQILHSLLAQYQEESDPYQRAFQAVRAQGGDVKTVQSVRNWIHGRTVFVRDKRNVLAVCRAAGSREPKRTSDMIYQSMQKLWSFHRLLGRKLGALIRRQISYALDPGAPVDDIVEAPGGVRLSLGDLAEALEIHEVVSVMPGTVWEVPSGVVGWVISGHEWAKLLATGLVKEE